MAAPEAVQNVAGVGFCSLMLRLFSKAALILVVLRDRQHLNGDWVASSVLMMILLRWGLLVHILEFFVNPTKINKRLFLNSLL